MKTTMMLSVLAAVLAVGGSASADLHQLHHVDMSTTAEREAAQLTTKSTQALMDGHFDEAVALANQAIAANSSDPWGYYDKGVALTELGKTDEAVAAFIQADSRFTSADEWGRSVSLYGRARVLSMAGRCKDADPVFRQYASLVGKDAPSLAQSALQTAKACQIKRPAVAMAVPPRPQPQRQARR